MWICIFAFPLTFPLLEHPSGTQSKVNRNGKDSASKRKGEVNNEKIRLEGRILLL